MQLGLFTSGCAGEDAVLTCTVRMVLGWSWEVCVVLVCLQCILLVLHLFDISHRCLTASDSLQRWNLYVHFPVLFCTFVLCLV